MGKPNARARFGWQGIEIDVPRSWELSRHGGTRAAGYAVLDDGAQLRLQVRWEAAMGARPDLGASVERYRRSLDRRAKVPLLFEAQDPDFLPKRLREGADVAPFYWTGEQAAHGMAWHCHACHRLVLVEALFPCSEVDHTQARQILGSVQDHRADRKCLWSVYGFAFLAPDSYDLDETEFVPGRVRFGLRESREAWLRVERWGVASQWLRKAPLDQWPAELLKLMRVSPVGEIEQRVVEVNGHTGRGFVHRPALRRGLKGHDAAQHGVLWLCPEMDKVFVVIASGGHEGVCEAVAASIECA